MERIVFLDRNSIKANIRPPAFVHEWRDYPETLPREVVEKLRDATIAISNKVPIREADLSRLPALKFIAVAATGVDNIDLRSCHERGIIVSNVRDYARQSVPEHVLMMILALRRNLISYREALRQGAWQRATQFCLLDYPIHDLHSSTLGIIGYGTLGHAVEKLARAFEMNVLIAEHRDAKIVRAGRTPFEEVLRRSDSITLHLPLTEETRHLMGAAELAMMRSGALLINCARGGVVDEVALAEALKIGVIAGAGIDVLSREPPQKGNPLLDLQLPNLIVTPHVAWSSIEAMQILADQLVDNIEAFVRGEPQNTVDGKSSSVNR